MNEPNVFSSHHADKSYSRDHRPYNPQIDDELRQWARRVVLSADLDTTKLDTSQQMLRARDAVAREIPIDIKDQLLAVAEQALVDLVYSNEGITGVHRLWA